MDLPPPARLEARDRPCKQQASASLPPPGLWAAVPHLSARAANRFNPARIARGADYAALRSSAVQNLIQSRLVRLRLEATPTIGSDDTGSLCGPGKPRGRCLNGSAAGGVRLSPPLRTWAAGDTEGWE
jgi:hypothetical protein